MNERNLLLLRKLPLSRCSLRISYRQYDSKIYRSIGYTTKISKIAYKLATSGKSGFTPQDVIVCSQAWGKL